VTLQNVVVFPVVLIRHSQPARDFVAVPRVPVYRLAADERASLMSSTLVGSPLVITSIGRGGPKSDHPLIQLCALAVDDRTLQRLASIDLKVWFAPTYAESKSLNEAGWDAHVWTKQAIDAETAAKRFAEFLRKHSLPVIKPLRRKVARLAAYDAPAMRQYLWQFFRDAGSVALPVDEHIILDIQQRVMWHLLDRGVEVGGVLGLQSACTKLDVHLKTDEHDGADDAMRCVRLTAGLLWKLRRLEKSAVA